MKVLLVSSSFPDIRCGIGDYTARLATELARRPGIEVTVLTSENDRIQPAAAGAARVVSAGGWGLRSLPGLTRDIRRLAPDLVHIQYPAVGYARALGIVFLPLLLRWLGRIPMVLTVHERRERRWTARMATNVMALSSNVVVVLDAVEAAALRRSLPSSAPKVRIGRMISTVPVVPSVDRGDWRARIGVAAGDILMVSFGLVHPRRRLELIVDALAELAARQIRTHALFIGGEAEYDLETAHEYALSLRREVEARGLGGVTRWLDHAEAATVSAALQAADVAVLLYPDGASGRNTTLQAALEHGVPVVTTVGAATPEEMRHQEGLRFLPEGTFDGKDIADAVCVAVRTEAGPSPHGAASSRIPEHVDFHLALYRGLLP